MASFLLTRVPITKVGEDSYRFVLQNKFRAIDETVNGSQLTSMLRRESLADANVGHLTVEYVMARLDAINVGQVAEVTVVERVK